VCVRLGWLPFRLFANVSHRLGILTRAGRNDASFVSEQRIFFAQSRPSDPAVAAYVYGPECGHPQVDDPITRLLPSWGSGGTR